MVKTPFPGAPSPALEGVSFAVPAGSTLGVVGRSGSGKSTITRLLQGINRDYTGFVKLDGSELREIELSHLRRSFGVVLQDNFLFRGTVRDNIAAGRPGITLEDVVRAARLAGAEEFIERLPQGYDTPIGDDGARLSGGQRQRLGLARAVYRNPRLVVLRVTAYGQDGPYRDRPGFGTLAEALAGLASVSGYDDRPPLLPANYR